MKWSCVQSCQVVFKIRTMTIETKPICWTGLYVYFCCKVGLINKGSWELTQPVSSGHSRLTCKGCHLIIRQKSWAVWIHFSETPFTRCKKRYFNAFRLHLNAAPSDRKWLYLKNCVEILKNLHLYVCMGKTEFYITNQNPQRSGCCSTNL